MTEDEAKRIVEERLKKHLFPKKTFILIFLLGIVFGYVSSPSVLNQAWAWQVASSMITINGLIIGFSILAVTVFLGKGYSEDLFKNLADESTNDMVTDLERLSKNHKETSKKDLTKLVSHFVYPLIDIFSFRYTIILSMVCSLVSIGSCFMLFGVSPERISNPLSRLFFSNIYVLAITFFLESAYYIVYGISNMLRGAEIDTKRGFKIVMDTLERKLEKFEKESESNRKQSKENHTTQ